MQAALWLKRSANAIALFSPIVVDGIELAILALLPLCNGLPSPLPVYYAASGVFRLLWTCSLIESLSADRTWNGHRAVYGFCLITALAPLGVFHLPDSDEVLIAAVLLVAVGLAASFWLAWVAARTLDRNERGRSVLSKMSVPLTFVSILLLPYGIWALHPRVRTAILQR